jgi:hypothetical protein
MKAQEMFDDAYSAVSAKLGSFHSTKERANIAIRIVEADVTLQRLEAEREAQTKGKGAPASGEEDQQEPEGAQQAT